MTAKELKRLSRMELLQLLLVRTQETEHLKEENRVLKEQLECRTIQVTEAGNIADASLKINGVMEAAQEAARQYLDNIRQINEQTKLDCMTLEDQTRDKCRTLEEQTRLECEARTRQTEEICAQIEEATQRKCDELTGKALAKARTAQQTPTRRKGRR
jgi:hypothetical protein